LGFARKSAEKVVDRIMKDATEDPTVETIIKLALKNL
jgi:Holliday junction DNA helicase RuvA